MKFDDIFIGMPLYNKKKINKKKSEKKKPTWEAINKFYNKFWKNEGGFKSFPRPCVG